MWLERLLYSKNCFFLLTSGYLLQAPNNLTFFSISLEGSSYLGSTVQSKRQKRTNYPSAHSCTALTCSFSLSVMLLAAVASDCSVSILLFRSWFTWIPMPDDMRSNPQDSTWPITETKKRFNRMTEKYYYLLIVTREIHVNVVKKGNMGLQIKLISKFSTCYTSGKNNRKERWAVYHKSLRTCLHPPPHPHPHHFCNGRNRRADLWLIPVGIWYSWELRHNFPHIQFLILFSCFFLGLIYKYHKRKNEWILGFIQLKSSHDAVFSKLIMNDYKI